MYIRDQDLDPIVGNGGAFETLLHDLIRAEAWACGIRQDQIDWDFRTNVGDGGRDVLLRVGNPHAYRTQFIPAVPSVWSAKSGKDGLSPSTLRKEVRKHPKVIEHLQNGGAYCWCVVAPADNNDTRDKLREVAVELANECGFGQEQIILIFRDTLTAWLKLHPGLIPIHLGVQAPWHTLDEWRRDFKTRWVDFGSRAELMATIREHLLGTGGSNVLHLAGLSGIGKTRTAFEVCCSDVHLKDVLYFRDFNSFSKTEIYLTRLDGARAAVVIDEVELGDWDRLALRLEDYSDRLRILTIGPAPKGRVAAREGILEVPPPQGQEEVVQVIQASDPTLSSDSARDIAGWCDHDLRLALLLVQANRGDPGLRNQPIASVEEVWDRIMTLFRVEISDPGKFGDFYAIASLCIDLGNQDKHRLELEYIAKHFGKSETDLDDFVTRAGNCGLGGQHGSFFEAGPRALSRRIFERFGWPRVRPTVSQFFKSMPTARLQKRFLERGHEASAGVREEVVSALAEWFHSQFPSLDITLIQDRQGSRVFAAYTEMDPDSGLRWLRDSVERAPSEVLLALDGEPDGSGGWRGRRQVVWLCEHLACFPEHFWDCEAVLFRLALHETEKGIGNNSTEVWKQLFRPVLSGTAVPFHQRLAFLLTRVAQAKLSEIAVVMSGAAQMLDTNFLGSAPPRVVGGKLVPEEWRPQTMNELHNIQTLAAHELIIVMRALSDEEARSARTTVIQEIGDFLRLGCLDELRDWLTPALLEESELRQLRLRLDEQISWLKLNTKSEKAWAKQALRQVMSWRQNLDPNDLESQVREVTGRGYWEHGDRLQSDEAVSLYQQLAGETLNNLEVLGRLVDWFNSSGPQSAFQFGDAMGRSELQLNALGCMRDWLVTGRCLQLVTGYFHGVSTVRGELPDEMVSQIDLAAEFYPYHACYVTVNADYSERGVKRLLRTLPTAPQDSCAVLFELIRGPWPGVLSDDSKVDLVRLLLSLAQNGDEMAIRMALDLVGTWERKRTFPLPDAYTEAILDVLHRCLTGDHAFQVWDWQQVIKLIPESHADRKCEILAMALTSRETKRWSLSREALEMLTEIAEKDPQRVIGALGARIVGPNGGLMVRVRSFPGLFEAIGLEVIRAWVNAVGVEGAVAIARHVRSPAPTESDPLQVPPLTEWLLSEYENDDRVFRAFCAGRHAFEVRWGPARESYKGSEERMAPYRKHPLRRVREWAKFEIDSARRDIEWDERHSEEMDRE